MPHIDPDRSLICKKVRARMVATNVDAKIAGLLDAYLIGTSATGRAVLHVAILDLMVAASAL